MRTRARHIAGFVYDALPVSLIPSNAARDEGDDGSSGDDEGSGDGDGAEGSSDRGDDDSDANAGDQDGTDDDDEIRNPRLKQVSEEAKRHRLAAKAERERADDLQRQLDAAPGVTAITEARQERDFYREAVSEFNDIDAAWKLRDESLISTDVDGITTGIDAAVKKLKQSYPHLADDPTTDDTRKRTTQVPAAPGSGGSPTNPRRGGDGNSTPRKALDSKFPALARNRRR